MTATLIRGGLSLPARHWGSQKVENIENITIGSRGMILLPAWWQSSEVYPDWQSHGRRFQYCTVL